MNKIKMLVAGAVAATSIGISLAGPVGAVTCPEGSLRQGEAPTLAQCNVPTDDDESSPTNGMTLMEVVQMIINLILALLGIVTVLMIIIGGVQYTTSTGDPAKAAKAKNTILYGVIGLVIALLSFAIVNFVLDNVFKVGSGSDDTTSVDSSSSSGSSSSGGSSSDANTSGTVKQNT